MKKIVVAICAFVLGSTLAVAAPGFSGKKIKNSKIVQATRDTTVEFAGARIFVPKGHTVIIGQKDDGTIVIRGLSLQNLQVNDSTFSTNGFSVLAYRPSNNVVFMSKGNSLTVTDALGRTSTVSEGGAISTQNASVNSDNSAILAAQADQMAAQMETELPAFVAETETSSTASQQASQDVKETETELSPSAPR